MLDFRPGSARSSGRVPYHKQYIDSGRLLMMIVSSVLLLGLIFTLGRPRGQQPAGPATAAQSAQQDADQLPAGSRVPLIGGAILAAALCVAATALFVLYRMARRGRVQFTVRDVAEAEPDFRSLEAQPPMPSARESLADVAAEETRAKSP